MTLENKVAFVTGGGRAIGRCIAMRLARDGANIVLFAPEEDEVNKTADDIRELGRTALPVVGDVTREDQVVAAVRNTNDALGPIDILVNNAGVAGPTARVADVGLDEWNETIAVNLTGAFLCSKAVARQMIERRSGKMINIASVAGKIGYALRSPYAVSKWGLIGLTRTLSKEFGEFGVQVNAICPGPVEGARMTELINRRAKELGQTVEQVYADYVETTSMGRMVKQVDVAAMVAFLAGPEADNITGDVIDVSAGFFL